MSSFNDDGTLEIPMLLQQNLMHAQSEIALHVKRFMQTDEPESLHRYRIHLRFSRSLCQEFGSFLEKKRRKVLLQTFKFLQKETNAMRDLDVFLACIGTYKNRVEAVSLAELEAVENALRQERQDAYDRFCERYARESEMLSSLQRCVEDANLYLTPTQKHASHRLEAIVRARVKKIAKLSQHLVADASNERLHQLRLHYKTLRYTCDALGWKDFAKSLKPMQTALGNVQDKHVQIKRIKRYNTLHQTELRELSALLKADLREDKRTCIATCKAENLKKRFRRFQRCDEAR
ncbi:CHAD domain-containing protein [Sulfurospirillum sp. hDNRA2]|uniref:CHAD domain-containing protein n=1 Tax=Sulfurospirillum sp. hDNRA2 TaxID=3237298 RepID=UPI0020B863BE|nr:CHAD domain-containing protein [Sulfurospirillum sp. DNRA8]MCP3651428.1 CHAD domain-containing protein [Sulfurospirillum sp. DNRA8]MCR1810275.1 CHAD domain-containing protein [Sulfurospirillum sp. DNRA8]